MICLEGSGKKYNFAGAIEKETIMNNTFATYYRFYFYFAGNGEAGSCV